MRSLNRIRSSGLKIDTAQTTFRVQSPDGGRFQGPEAWVFNLIPFQQRWKPSNYCPSILQTLKIKAKSRWCNAPNTSRGVQDAGGVGGGCAAHEQFVPESELSRGRHRGPPTTEGCSCMHCRPVRAGTLLKIGG